MRISLWKLSLIVLCFALFALGKSAVADPTAVIVAGSPSLNPVTPGQISKVSLQAGLLPSESPGGKECTPTDMTYEWSIVKNSIQYSSNGETFTPYSSPGSPVTPPSFSLIPPDPKQGDQFSNVNPVTLQAATTTQTTPDYWEVEVQVAITYKDPVCGDGTASASKELIFTVGNKPTFTITVSPNPVTVPSSPTGIYATTTGVTANVTVQSINGFAGTVTLSAVEMPGNLMADFYDPNNRHNNPTPNVITLTANSKYTVTMTLCNSGAMQGTYPAEVDGSSDKITETGSFQLTVGKPSSVYKGTPVNFKDGEGIRCATNTDYSCNGISGTATLPSPGSGNSDVILCSMAGENHGDSAYVYFGLDEEVGGVKPIEFGYQLGHTGNPSWDCYIRPMPSLASANSVTIVWKNPDGSDASSPPSLPTASSPVDMKLEAPGYIGDGALSGSFLDSNGAINAGYLAFYSGGDSIYIEARNPETKEPIYWNSATNCFERMNTIAQSPGPNGVYFYEDGTYIEGGGWAGVTIYHANGKIEATAPQDTGNSTYYAFPNPTPGLPYVESSICNAKDYSLSPESYSDEYGINISTIPQF